MKKTLINIIAESLSQNEFHLFNVPGYGGTDVLEIIKDKKEIKSFINLNEEAAFSISYGVSSNGKRSALLIKSQGFAKAANAITSSLSTETIAANLIFVFDDTAGKSSDNILRTKSLVKGTEAPYVQIGKDPGKEISDSIRLSEKAKLPVVVIVDCQKLMKEFNSKVYKVSPKKIINSPNFLTRVACPILTRNQRDFLEQKLQGHSTKFKGPQIKDIRDILPAHIKSSFTKYEKFFQVFKSYRPEMVSGDAGTSALFAFEPYRCIDTCTYMGGGPGMAIGAHLAGIDNSVCITGDFSFFSAGILGFQEALIHNIPLKLVIFDNRKAQATGGQDISPILMEKFRAANNRSIDTLALNKAEPSQIEASITRLLSSKELSILIIEVF